MTEGRNISRRALFGGGVAEKKPKTVETVSIPGLGSVRLVSSAHTVPNTLEELGSAQAIGLETGFFSVYDDLDKIKKGLKDVLSHPQYKHLLAEATRHR